MSRTLSIARAKLRYIKVGNSLDGYLTPSEIHALIEAGYTPAPGYEEKDIPSANGAKPKPRWFYFAVPSGKSYEDGEFVVGRRRC